MIFVDIFSSSWGEKYSCWPEKPLLQYNCHGGDSDIGSIDVRSASVVSETEVRSDCKTNDFHYDHYEEMKRIPFFLRHSNPLSAETRAPARLCVPNSDFRLRDDAVQPTSRCYANFPFGINGSGTLMSHTVVWEIGKRRL
ncbi:hypothetical protein EVAR_34766_1 [Eumeta japonica]|uniref:Uncharacterized protein n=1 Tax=Eumeta variegata TaxID=151549 RepID=A0A4C1ZKC3_EUMVA|nr:hypothetical protein EVAR_34766_1 [Eumeta japonica]